MIGRGIRLGAILGIPIRIDYSWTVIAVLLTAGMAVGLGQSFPYLGFLSRLLLGLSACLLLFASVLAHELSHAIIALRHDVGIRSITLFIFGGAAEMLEEPRSAHAEFSIAIAGPIMSGALAGLFGAFYAMGLGLVPPPFMDVMLRLAVWNVILVAFNIVPGFPLDGGRVLRAALWGIWGQLAPATRVASAVGSFLGALVMFLGLMFVFVFGNLIGGIWFFIIGMFLRHAARSSYRQVLVRQALEGVKARDLMTSDVPCVPPGMTLEAVVDEVILPRGVVEVPVVDRGLLVGMLSFQSFRGKGSAALESLTASDVMTRDFLEETISPDEDAFKVLARLGSDDHRLAVVSGGVLAGIVSREDALRRLSLILELREERSNRV